MRIIAASVVLSVVAWMVQLPAQAAEGPVHGLWVWKTASVLQTPGSAEKLRDFCTSKAINEVYLSISSSGAPEDTRIIALIALLHQSGMRVEALLGSTDADKPGKPRDEFLAHVRAIVQFNQKHPGERFDGIHLDIEPHQRDENKGAGNLKFLPDLIDTYHAVRSITGPAEMSVNADIESKVLKSEPDQRRALLTSVDRVTLMLYEQSSPDDGKSAAAKMQKLRRVSDKFLEMAYDGLTDAHLARMCIALRTPDYGDLLPDMLKSLDESHRGNPRYLGWGRHSYNDHLAVH